jgi:hypothetical protein
MSRPTVLRHVGALRGTYRPGLPWRIPDRWFLTNFRSAMTLMKRLPRVATEMALHVLAYNLTRVLNIVGIKPLMAAVGA